MSKFRPNEVSKIAKAGLQPTNADIDTKLRSTGIDPDRLSVVQLVQVTCGRYSILVAAIAFWPSALVYRLAARAHPRGPVSLPTSWHKAIVGAHSLSCRLRDPRFCNRASCCAFSMETLYRGNARRNSIHYTRTRRDCLCCPRESSYGFHDSGRDYY
jgi:hypothetical protein